MNGIKKLFGMCAMAMVALVATPACLFAQGPALDTTNIGDIAAWVPVLAAAVGGLIAAVLAVYFAIQVVRVGIMWIRRFAK